MALPEPVAVKISSEAAGYLSLTPVVSQDMPLREFLELLLDAVGPDSARIAELLRRGSVVSGGSRLRWAGMQATVEEVAAAVAAVPGPDPAASFAAARCLRAGFITDHARIVVERETGAAKRAFRRRSFWDALMRAVEGIPLACSGYGYRERAHRFGGVLTSEAAAQIRNAVPLLAFSGLREQLTRAALNGVELTVAREQTLPPR